MSRQNFKKFENVNNFFGRFSRFSHIFLTTVKNRMRKIVHFGHYFRDKSWRKRVVVFDLKKTKSNVKEWSFFVLTPNDGNQHTQNVKIGPKIHFKAQWRSTCFRAKNKVCKPKITDLLKLIKKLTWKSGRFSWPIERIFWSFLWI